MQELASPSRPTSTLIPLQSAITCLQSGTTPLQSGATISLQLANTPIQSSVTSLHPGAMSLHPLHPDVMPLQSGAIPLYPGATPLQPGATPLYPGTTPLQSSTSPLQSPLQSSTTPLHPTAMLIQSGATPFHSGPLVSLSNTDPQRRVQSAVSKAAVLAKENQQQITGEFVGLQTLVCDKLNTMQINMPKFLSFVRRLFQCADFIPASKKIDDIFDAITRNGLWDFLNYRPLRQIVKRFAKDDDEINTALQNYSSALAGYLAATKLPDYIASMSPITGEKVSLSCARNDERYYEKLTMKLDEKITEKSMDYLIELWDNVSDYLHLPSLNYLLDEICEGCISVTWLIPPIATPTVILMIDNPETAKFFSKLGIIRMEVNDMCLYEQEPDVETDIEQNQEKEDSFIKQFSDSQKQVEEEASHGVAKKAVEQKQDSLSEELPHQDKEGSGWSEQLEALQTTVNIERNIRKRTEEENGELRATIAYMEVEIGQLREKITGLECMLSQTQEETREQLEKIIISKNRVAVGHGLQYGETSQIAHFHVHLTDANGKPCVEMQDVKAELKSLVDGSIKKAKVLHQTTSAGSYEVSYQPSIRGRHELSVVVNGEAIAGSPFRVYVQQPPQLMGQPVRVIRGLDKPYRATVSSSGQLIVTERTRMSVFDGHGELSHWIDSIKLQPRKLLDLTGVAIDDSGTLYVCDGNSHQLLKVSTNGNILESVGGKGHGPRQFYNPEGITLRDTKLYICDQGNHRIQIFSCDLNFISSFGRYGSGKGEFSKPSDVAFDKEGNMYVVEEGNHRVQVFSSSGKFLRIFGKRESGELNYPCGIHVDRNTVYITEEYNHRISIFTTLGEFVSTFGTEGDKEGEFNEPIGITIDSDGFLYVCDYYNGRIQMF